MSGIIGEVTKGILVGRGKNMSKDTLKKIGLFGIGVIAITQEKIEEFTQEMIKHGEMNREEGKQFVKDVLDEKNKQLKELCDSMNQKVKECMQECMEKNVEVATKKDICDLATKDDINELRERLDKIDSIFRNYQK